jgi:hypothetical protein
MTNLFVLRGSVTGVTQNFPSLCTLSEFRLGVCTENSIRVDEVTKSPKLAE